MHFLHHCAARDTLEVIQYLNHYAAKSNRKLKVAILNAFMRPLALNTFNRAAVFSISHLRRVRKDGGPPPHKAKRPRAIPGNPPQSLLSYYC